MPVAMILVGVLCLIGAVLAALDGWADVFFGGLFAACLVLLIGGGIWLSNIQGDECARAGGHMQQTGRLVPILISTGKSTSVVMLPDTECVTP